MPLSQELIGWQNYTVQPQPSDSIGSGGCSRWQAELDLAEISGSVTIVIEYSQVGQQPTDWVQLFSFGALATPGQVIKQTFRLPTPDFTVNPWQMPLLRANVTSFTGSATFRVALTQWFVDPTYDPNGASDGAQFSKELRTFADGYGRIVGQAEDDVITLFILRKTIREPFTAYGAPLPVWPYRWTPPTVDFTTPELSEAYTGKPRGLQLDIDLTIPGIFDAIRRAIVTQAEHLYHRHRLSLDPSPTAQVTLRQMTYLAPGLQRRVRPYRAAANAVWRGR